MGSFMEDVERKGNTERVKVLEISTSKSKDTSSSYGTFAETRKRCPFILKGVGPCQAALLGKDGVP